MLTRAARVALTGVGGYAIAQALLLAIAALRGASHAKAAVAFGRDRRAVGRDGPRVLVVGDSTGVGVGAGAPSASLAGLLARDFDTATIENRALAGARIADVLGQLDGLDPTARYDVALVHAGGNDILKRARVRALGTDARAVLDRLRGRVRHVVWFGSANVGLSRLFLPPLGRLVTLRMRRAHDVLRTAVEQDGGIFVDYFREAGCDPYSHRPDRYYASDGVHPSRAAYRYCYQVLRRRVPLDRLLETAHRTRP